MPDDRLELSTPRFPIRVAARRAGISVAALRAWERRYRAVAPARSTGEQRLYSEHDVERIALLRRLTNSGHVISAIASAPTDELRRLVEVVSEIEAGAENPVRAAPAETGTADAAERAERHRVLRACLRATRA